LIRLDIVESNLLCIYAGNGEPKWSCIKDLREALKYMENDDLTEAICSLIDKLENCSKDEYKELVHKTSTI